MFCNPAEVPTCTNSTEGAFTIEDSNVSYQVITIDGIEYTTTYTSAIGLTLTNPPSGSTAFSLKILQNSTGYSVGIDTFKNVSGTAIPVKWPAAVVPTVTTTAEKTDIYSFMIFDGDNITDSGEGLFGVVGGQNFA